MIPFTSRSVLASLSVLIMDDRLNYHDFLFSSSTLCFVCSGRGRGRESGTREDRNCGRGSGGDAESERIDALGRLL